MKNVLALLLAGGRVDELSVLTLTRPTSAVPFGSMYRIIDFPLSNLMHSQIERVGILAQYRSLSLYNHIGIGSWWDFVGRDRGITMLSPSIAHNASDWYKGTADAVYQNLDFIQEQDPEVILILSGDHIYKMDYRPMLAYHREKKADVTAAFLPLGTAARARFGMASIDDEDGKIGGRIIDYKEKPSDGKHTWASMTIYLFRPELLYELLADNAGKAASREFGRDILPQLPGKYRVYGYKFHGYWGYTRTLDEYWANNMELLQDKPKIDLQEWHVRTNLDHDRLRDRPPVRIGKNARLSGVRVQKGCQIDGEVENSILFPGVKVQKGAKVRNSILFCDTVVEEGAIVDKIISDVEVQVKHGCHLGIGEAESPNRDYPTLLKSGISVIGRAVHLPEGFRLGRNCIVAPGLTPSSFQHTEYESGATVK